MNDNKEEKVIDAISEDEKKLSAAIEALIEKNQEKLEELKLKFDSFLQDHSKTADMSKKILESAILPQNLSRELAGEYLASILDNLKKGNDNGFADDFRERLTECKSEAELDKCFAETYESCNDVDKIIRQSAEGMFSLMLDQFITASKEKKENEAMKAELEKYRKLSEEYLEMSRNLKRDYTRMRDRLTKEKEEIVQLANKKLLSQLLEVTDNLDEALAECRKEPDGEKSVHYIGARLVLDRMNKIFTDNQVKEMEVIGKHFDPVVHEALSQDTESDKEEGTITEVFKKGYLYQESVLRSALVKVAVGKDKLQQAE